MKYFMASISFRKKFPAGIIMYVDMYASGATRNIGEFDATQKLIIICKFILTIVHWYC